MKAEKVAAAAGKAGRRAAEVPCRAGAIVSGAQIALLQPAAGARPDARTPAWRRARGPRTRGTDARSRSAASRSRALLQLPPRALAEITTRRTPKLAEGRVPGLTSAGPTRG